MENNSSSVTGDSADLSFLNALLASAEWTTGLQVAPSCEPTDSDDAQEAR